MTEKVFLMPTGLAGVNRSSVGMVYLFWKPLSEVAYPSRLAGGGDWSARINTAGRLREHTRRIARAVKWSR